MICGLILQLSNSWASTQDIDDLGNSMSRIGPG